MPSDSSQYRNIEDFVNDVIAEFAQELMIQRIANIKRNDAEASRELINSYAYEIRKATTIQAAKFMLSFKDYARFLDMKKMNWEEMPPIEDIKEWIRHKGLGAFKRLPKNRYKSPPSAERKLRDLAWGIALSKKKGKKKKRRYPLQKGTDSLIADMYQEIQEGYADKTLADIKKAFQQ